MAAWLGTGESLLPRILTVDEVVERFEAVTPDDMLRVARRYAAPRPGAPGRAGAVPFGGALREGAGRGRLLMAAWPDVGRDRHRPDPGRAWRWPAPSWTRRWYVLAEGSLRRQIARLDADADDGRDLEELDAARALLAEALWR